MYCGRVLCSGQIRLPVPAAYIVYNSTNFFLTFTLLLFFPGSKQIVWM